MAFNKIDTIMTQTHSPQQTTETYGSWLSMISSDLLTQGLTGVKEPMWDQGSLYWLESRPNEGGRSTLMVLDEGADSPVELTPHPIDVKSRVHEYGGGSYSVNNGLIIFVAGREQQIMQMVNRGEPEMIYQQSGYRFADPAIDPNHHHVYLVAEIHQGDSVENQIVQLDLAQQSIKPMVTGDDFYSNPRLNLDGTRLAWVSWRLPNMPWDNTELWTMAINQTQASARCIAGDKESIAQPRWLNNHTLLFVSDRNNWWTIYQTDVRSETLEITACCNKEAEFATPAWVFGMSCYDVLNENTLITTYSEQGTWSLATLTIDSGQLDVLDTPCRYIEGVCTDTQKQRAAFVGASPTEFSRLYRLESRLCQAVTTPDITLDQQHISVPLTLELTHKHRSIQSFFYPPTHADYTGPKQALPPLIVMCHGGPSAATHAILSLKIQFWTNRGFAVLDVNYTGSTGFGREFRHALYGQWGLADVEDIIAATQACVDEGRVNPNQLIIRGSSAGGFSVLAALTQSRRFNAGASLYGIGDLHQLAQDTHKFEAKYLDQLIAPYTEENHSIYSERSPLNHVDQLTQPIIFLQGLQDKVVPPNQARAMVNAMVERNIPVAYATYANEGHGFRNSDTIKHSLMVEYGFYADQFGFETSETLPDIPYVTDELNP